MGILSIEMTRIDLHFNNTTLAVLKGGQRENPRNQQGIITFDQVRGAEVHLQEDCQRVVASDD